MVGNLNKKGYHMNPTTKKLHDQHLRLAADADRAGDRATAAHHRQCALTLTYPIGNFIAATYN